MQHYKRFQSSLNHNVSRGNLFIISVKLRFRLLFKGNTTKTQSNYNGHWNTFIRFCELHDLTENTRIVKHCPKHCQCFTYFLREKPFSKPSPNVNRATCTNNKANIINISSQIHKLQHDSINISLGTTLKISA